MSKGEAKMTYEERKLQAKRDLEKIVSEHGITVLIDGLASIAVDNQKHFSRESYGAVWQDIVGALNVLRSATRKLVGTELPAEEN